MVPAECSGVGGGRGAAAGVTVTLDRDLVTRMTLGDLGLSRGVGA